MSNKKNNIKGIKIFYTNKKGDIFKISPDFCWFLIS